MSSQRRLRIVTMKWQNLRNYETVPHPTLGASEAEFKLSETKTTLLQIQNNYGKTTTMRLLRAAFSGRTIAKEHLSGYGYRKGGVGWGGDPNGSAMFSVGLTLNDKYFEIQLVIDPKRRTQEFYTYKPMDAGSGGGRSPGWNPPDEFRQLFENKVDFVDLFILDGEMAEEMVEATGGKKVQKAIEQVTGLSEICDLVDTDSGSGRINELVNTKLREALGDSGRKQDGLDRKIDRIESHISKVQKQREEVGKELDSLRAQLKKVEQEITKFDDNAFQNDKDLKDATTSLEAERAELVRLTDECISDLSNPQTILQDTVWSSISRFFEVQIAGKLPRGLSQNWFNEILEQHENCICGTAWTEEMRTHLLQNKEEYLDDLLMPRVKHLQTNLVNAETSQTLQVIKIKLDEQRKSVKRAEQKVRQIRNRMPENERKLMASLSARKAKLEGEVENTLYKFRCYDSSERDFISANKLNQHTNTNLGVPNIQPANFEKIINLSELDKVHKHLRKLILQGSKAATKARGASRMETVVSRAINQLLNEVKAEIQSKLNKRTRTMPGVDVRIELGSKSMVFKNASGEIQDGLNESAKLGAVYGFVASLNDYSNISLPIVVDTPLAGFGRGMAVAWQQVVQRTFDQTIALINSSEKGSLEEWWSVGGRQNPDVSLFTFLRENENPLTGADHDWDGTGDADSKTTGPMFISSELSDFRDYERDVFKNSGVSV